MVRSSIVGEDNDRRTSISLQGIMQLPDSINIKSQVGYKRIRVPLNSSKLLRIELSRPRFPELILVAT